MCGRSQDFRRRSETCVHAHPPHTGESRGLEALSALGLGPHKSAGEVGEGKKTELRTPIGKRLHFRIKPRAGHMESGNAPTAMAMYMSYTNASRSGVGNRTDPVSGETEHTYRGCCKACPNTSHGPRCCFLVDLRPLGHLGSWPYLAHPRRDRPPPPKGVRPPLRTNPLTTCKASSPGNKATCGHHDPSTARHNQIEVDIDSIKNSASEVQGVIRLATGSPSPSLVAWFFCVGSVWRRRSSSPSP